MAVPNFGLVVLVGGMVLDELGWISYWIGYGGFSCNLGLLKARGTRKECCDWFGCKGGSRVEVWWLVALVFITFAPSLDSSGLGILFPPFWIQNATF